MTTVSIVVPCYTEARWLSLVESLRAARAQTIAAQVFVVVDHNPALAARLRQELPALVEGVVVLENRFTQGVSGTRNTGAFAAIGDVVAFLDDDTKAEPTWLERLLAAYLRDPAAVGAGGTIAAEWEDGVAATWLPPQFLWAIGVTNPEQAASRVRNVWAANMLVNRAVFVEIGGFSEGFGKLGDVPEPEDTELCLRMLAHAGQDHAWVFAPEAVVYHRVARHRATWSYFARRCWSEGAGKAALAARLDGRTDVLQVETGFVRSVLTDGLRREAAGFATGEPVAARRAAAILLGVGSAGLGYLVSRARRGRPTVRRAAAQPAALSSVSSGPCIPGQRVAITTAAVGSSNAIDTTAAATREQVLL